jgi:HNH endonuclease
MTPCVLWTGYVTGAGYPQAGRCTLVHRRMYELAHGPIPPGYVVHHACHVKTCVNPDHLTAMPLAEHNRLHDTGALAAANADRRAASHCKHGHEFNEANTYWTRDGKRSCRRCDQARPRRVRKVAA